LCENRSKDWEGGGKSVSEGFRGVEGITEKTLYWSGLFSLWGRGEGENWEDNAVCRGEGILGKRCQKGLVENGKWCRERKSQQGDLRNRPNRNVGMGRLTLKFTFDGRKRKENRWRGRWLKNGRMSTNGQWISVVFERWGGGEKNQ